MSLNCGLCTRVLSRADRLLAEVCASVLFNAHSTASHYPGAFICHWRPASFIAAESDRQLSAHATECCRAPLPSLRSQIDFDPSRAPSSLKKNEARPSIHFRPSRLRSPNLPSLHPPVLFSLLPACEVAVPIGTTLLPSKLLNDGLALYRGLSLRRSSVSATSRCRTRIASAPRAVRVATHTL